MSILNSKDFNKFLYHYDRKHCNDSVINTINKRKYATGEEQPYLTDRLVQKINDQFEHMTYEQKKEMALMHRNKEEK